MNNMDQIKWLKSRLYMMRNQESMLFSMLTDGIRTEKEVNDCVGAIIILSGYILRVSNAMKRMEADPSLMINLEFLDAFKNKNKWR